MITTNRRPITGSEDNSTVGYLNRTIFSILYTAPKQNTSIGGGVVCGVWGWGGMSVLFSGRTDGGQVLWARGGVRGPKIRTGAAMEGDGEQ